MNKLKSPYLVFFMLEILVGMNAGLTFRIVENRYWAALWTSTAFLLLGLALIYWCIKNLNYKKHILFYVAFVHTFVFTGPLMLARLIDGSEAPLQKVLFIDAIDFHRLATSSYALLVFVTFACLTIELTKPKMKT